MRRIIKINIVISIIINIKTGLRVCYLITNNGNGHLDGIVYELDPIYYSAEEVVGYAYERYTYMTKSGDDYVFVKGVSSNYEAMIGVGVSTGNKYTITYLPNN